MAENELMYPIRTSSDKGFSIKPNGSFLLDIKNNPVEDADWEKYYSDEELRKVAIGFYRQLRKLQEDPRYSPPAEILKQLLKNARDMVRKKESTNERTYVLAVANDTLTNDIQALVESRRNEYENFSSMLDFIEVNLLPLPTASINRRGEQHDADESIDLTREIEVDPKDPWGTFAVQQGWIRRGEDSRIPENIRKIERGILNWAIGYVTAELWDNPNNGEKKGEIEFMKFPVRRGSNRLDLSAVLYKHPGPEEGPGSGKEFREIFGLLEKILAAGMSWEHVITNPSHEAILKHLTDYMFEGGAWSNFQKLPSLGLRRETEESIGVTEPEFGQLIFEGLRWYANWNKEFIYLNNEEMQDLSNQVDDDIESGIIVIPHKRDLERALTELKDKRNKLPFAITSGTNAQPLPQNLVLSLYAVDSVGADDIPNYDHFKFLYAEEVKKLRQKKMESERQKKYGIHPLLEIGEGENVEGGTVEKHLIPMREEISIAIGCYALGIGEYRPRVGASGGKLTLSDGSRRDLTDSERHRAFDVGRSAEMFAFSTYEANGGPIFDDDVTAKSSLTAGRLGSTDIYRQNYENLGREGFFRDSLYIFMQLLPHSFKFMAVDGMQLRDLFKDRNKRFVADYASLGDSKGKKLVYLQLYGFTKEIYSALAYGIGKTVQGASLLKIAEVVAPRGLLSTEKYLRFEDKMLQDIVEFTDKQIGYYLDRMFIDVRVRDAAGSTYDREFWKTIPGTNFASPLYELMLNLPPEDWNILIEDMKRIGFKRAMIKPYMSSIIVESLIRSGAQEISIDQAQALKYVLSGQRPSLYGVGNRGRSVQDVLSSAEYAAAFNYTPAEATGLIRKANLTLRRGIEIFLARQGGV